LFSVLTVHPLQFILIIFIGTVGVMRRAKISVHSADVKNVLRSFSIEVPANSIDELQEVR